MAKYPDRRSATIPALHAAQRVHGWCSPEAIDQVAAVMQVTPAYLNSVATFYDMFWTHPTPRNDVFVCTNISCSLRGADEFFEAMIAAAEESEDVNVRSFECLGACDIAPMASVNGEYVGPLVTEDAAQIIEDLRGGGPVLEHKQLRYRRCADPGVEEGGADFSPPDEMPQEQTAGLGPERRPAGPPRADGADRDAHRRSRGAGQLVAPKILFEGIDEPGLNTLEVYERRGGYESLRKALAMEPDEVLQNIGDSQIRGRGGAGFRMGQKAGFLPHGDMDKYLVCNADESEPGTFKDRELMQKSPHMLIEGIMIAAYATEINKAFIYIRGEYAHQADILEAAVAEAAEAGYLGERHPRLAALDVASSSTAAPAPTSAARRRGCSTRSRASAATRG